MKKFKISSVLVMILSLISFQSFAQTHHFYVKGIVNYIDDNDSVVTGISIGDTIKCTITYDLSATDNNPLPTVGDYWYYDFPNGFDVHINDYTFKTYASDVEFLFEVVNDHNNSDNIVFRSYNNVFPDQLPPLTDTHISWQLDDPSQTALSGIELPDYIEINDFQQPFGFTIEGSNYDTDIDFMIRGEITLLDTVNIFLAVNELSYPDAYVYPNPSNNYLNIRVDREFIGSDYELIDQWGRIVLKGKLTDELSTLDIKGLTNGIYLVRLGESDARIFKILKK